MIILNSLKVLLLSILIYFENLIKMKNWFNKYQLKNIIHLFNDQNYENLMESCKHTQFF